jgi:hypothetical protein
MFVRDLMKVLILKTPGKQLVVDVVKVLPYDIQ